ncbi:MAG: hypothetical protein CO094_10105 [Anaerolineae bacterium CG_4_9_14_3_um_filter_57_17]|nr:MAG: hypothetical protein CO094_10105 [Anaerolineae bacterium CG_4_9_14_3_um_filter_57_17]
MAWSKSALYKPILASILNNRVACAMITGAAILQLGLVSAGLPAWQSPTHAVFGLPDPSCSLSRAIIALLRGDWRTSLTFHAFAPLFIAALSLIAIATVLPQWPRDKVVALVENLERHTGLTALLLISLVIYWLARLLILRETFIKLVHFGVNDNEDREKGLTSKLAVIKLS